MSKPCRLGNLMFEPLEAAQNEAIRAFGFAPRPPYHEASVPGHPCCYTKFHGRRMEIELKRKVPIYNGVERFSCLE